MMTIKVNTKLKQDIIKYKVKINNKKTKYTMKLKMRNAIKIRNQKLIRTNN